MSKVLKRSKCFISLFIVTVMILSMSIPAMCAQAAAITDIADHWAKNEISAWVEQGFIKGYPDNTFKPNNTISRAEFISLVNRLFAFSEKGVVTFTDVKESDWFYADFAKASKAGYLSGYEGKVVPDGFITRQEVATIAAKVKSLTEDAASANGFADAAAIPAGNKGFIGAVTKSNIMNGYPDGKFEPAKSITRAESVIVLNRLMSLKDTVKIEAINDKTATVGYTTTVAVKALTPDAKITAKSSDSNVVQVTTNGLQVYLKGISVGSATVTVTAKKDGLPDGVVTFKVDVTKSTGSSGGGGGGGGGSSSGGGSPYTPQNPVEDDSLLKAVKAVVGTSTTVSGTYVNGVNKIEVIYNGTKAQASLANGSFQFSITPGLAIGATITVKGYYGSTKVDSDVIQVVEDESKLTDLSAFYTPMSTEITGKCTANVTAVVLSYSTKTGTDEVIPANGAFKADAFQLPEGTVITAKAYVGTVLVDTDTVTAGTGTVQGDISELNAFYTPMSTEITGKCTAGISKVVFSYSTKTGTDEAIPANGTFKADAFQLPEGTVITAKAYVGALLVDTETVTAGAGTVQGDISELNAFYTPMSTEITGKCTAGISKVVFSYSTKTGTDEAIPANGTFKADAFQLPEGTVITAKAYVGTVLVDTETVTAGAGTVQGDISELKAFYTPMSTEITGKCTANVTKVILSFSTVAGTDEVIPKNGTFKSDAFQLSKGTVITAKAYVGTVLVDTATVTADVETPDTEAYITNLTAVGTGIGTDVKGSYNIAVDKIEVIYVNPLSKQTMTKPAVLNPTAGTFLYGITPALSLDDTVTVKAYIGTELKDTDEVNVQSH